MKIIKDTIILELLDNQSSVKLFSIIDEFSMDKMYRFLINLRNILELLITSCKKFSGKFLQLQSENIW